MKNEDLCQVRRCRTVATIFYVTAGRTPGVCDHHWTQHCDDDHRLDLRVELKEVRRT